MAKVMDNHVKLVSACIICGKEFEHEPYQGGFANMVCDECKEAIKYAKELRKKEVMKNRDNISYKYVTRYLASADKEDWDGYNKIYHYSVSIVRFPEDQVLDGDMYNNDITYFTNYNDAQMCCDVLNKKWEEVHGE